jgi:hypothetical protein
MANRPRSSGATQTFAVPDEDDIYDHSPASITLLEEEFEPVEDTNSPSFPNNDINETLAAYFYDGNSNSNSVPTVEASLLHLLRQRLGQSTLLLYLVRNFLSGRDRAVLRTEAQGRRTRRCGSTHGTATIRADQGRSWS